MTSEADNMDWIYPISIKWTFTELFFNSYTGGERIESRRFILPGFPITYYLTIDYHQIDDDHSPGVSIKLNCYCDYNDVEIEANFKTELNPSNVNPTEIKCAFNDQNNEVECFVDQSWGLWNADGIYITLKGTFIIKELPIIPLSIRVPKINQEMFAENEKKDFTIISQCQKIKIHKSILQQVSPVFGRMLDSENWKETSEAKMDLSFLPFELTKIVMDSFYGKKHWGFLDKNEYIQIFQFADQYDITALKNAIKNCIILTPQNVVEYSNLTNETKCDELIRHCIDYIILCTQYSYPMKDIEQLTDSSKIQIAERMLITPMLKRNIEDENTSHDHCGESKDLAFERLSRRL